MATAELNITANLEGLRSELSKIKGITADEAQAMASQLNKSIRAAEAASKRATAATKAAAAKAAAEAQAAANKAKSAIEQTGEAAGDLGSSAGKLAGALDLLAPGLGSVATGVADIADVGEVAALSAGALGTALGTVVAVAAPIAAALAAATAAFALYSREQDQAIELANLQHDANQRLVGTINAVRDAELDLMVARGELNASQRETLSNAFAAQDAVKSLSESQREARLEAQKSIDTNESLLAGLASLDLFGIGAATGTLALADSLLGLSDSVQQGKDKIAILTDELVREQDAQKDLRRLKDATVSATETQTAVTEANTAAQQAAANAARQRATDEASVAAALAAEEEQERKLLAQNAEYLVSLRSLQDTARAASESRLEGEAAVDAALQRQVEKVNELAARQAEASMGNAAQLSAIEAARLDAVVALESEAAEKIDAIREGLSAKQTARNEREIAEAQSRNAAVLSSSGDLFAALASAAGEAADAQSKSSKDAAMTLYGVQKASAIVSAGINAALAVSQALGNLPPPASYIAAAASGVMGAAQVAAIASTPAPSFNDTPGVQQMTSRGNVSLASGDFFAAARDPAELQRQVGAMASPGPVVLEMRLGHRVLDRSVAQTVRQGGRLSRELRGMSGAGPTGHAR